MVDSKCELCKDSKEHEYHYWHGDIEEEYDHVDAHKVVTNLTCPNCATFHLVYTPKSYFEKGET